MNQGDRVVVRGRGLGTITAIRDGLIVVEETGLRPGEASQFEIDASHAADAMRPIVNRDEADHVLALLRTAAPRLPLEERALAYRRALKRGELGEQAALLAASYRGAFDPPEQQYQERLERSVYAELALVLGISHKRLCADIRAVVRGDPVPRSLALVDRTAELDAIEVPGLDGLREIGAMAIDDRIAVGELRPDVAAAARPGIWFAYARPDDDDDFVQLIAIHRDALADFARLDAAARVLGEAPIEAAHIAVFDEAIADDDEVIQRISEAAFEIVDGRAAVVALGGDGVARVSAAFDGGRAVYIRADL